MRLGKPKARQVEPGVWQVETGCALEGKCDHDSLAWALARALLPPVNGAPFPFAADAVGGVGEIPAGGRP